MDKNRKLLSLILIDDDDLNSWGLFYLLGRHFRIDSRFKCRNIAEAIETYASNKPELIIIDWRDSGSVHIETLIMAKRHFPLSKVMILTCQESDRSLVSYAMKHGADGFVFKSDPPSEIVRAVELILEGNVGMSCSVVNTLISHMKQVEKAIKFPPRETQIITLVSLGLTDKEIACRLGIGLSTVRTYLSRIMEKFGINRRTDITRCSIGNCTTLYNPCVEEL